MCISTIFNDPTFIAVMDSPIAGWVQQSYCSPREWLLPEYVLGGWSIMTWTGQVLIDVKRPRRSVQDDRRVGPITRLKELWQWLLPSTTDLRRRMESCLGDGRRLPLPQAIRRSNRMAHEAQKTSSENGGDDD